MAPDADYTAAGLVHGVDSTEMYQDSNFSRQTLDKKEGNPKYGVSRTPRSSFEGQLQRAVSDISGEIGRSSPNSKPLPDVENVQCECCGLFEECTPTYISRVKELFCGRWICGLCAEAVKEERERMGNGVSMEEALRSHIAVCVKFNKIGRSNPTLFMAEAMRELLKKSSQMNGARSKANSPINRDIISRGSIARSSSCIPAITRERSSSYK